MPVEPTDNELAGHLPIVRGTPRFHFAKFRIDGDVRVVAFDVSDPFGVDWFLMTLPFWFRFLNFFFRMRWQSHRIIIAVVVAAY